MPCGVAGARNELPLDAAELGKQGIFGRFGLYGNTSTSELGKRRKALLVFCVDDIRSAEAIGDIISRGGIPTSIRMCNTTLGAVLSNDYLPRYDWLPLPPETN